MSFHSKITRVYDRHQQLPSSFFYTFTTHFLKGQCETQHFCWQNQTGCLYLAVKLNDDLYNNWPYIPKMAKWLSWPGKASNQCYAKSMLKMQIKANSYLTDTVLVSTHTAGRCRTKYISAVSVLLCPETPSRINSCGYMDNISSIILIRENSNLTAYMDAK